MVAKRVGRPLRWRETRSESMMSLGHGRAQIQYVTIGGTRDGKVTHYQMQVIQDAGSFAEMGTILAPFMTRPMSSAVYDIPNIECRTTSVVTNTALTTAYRGAGRPEATAAAERAMDLFAVEIGMDPVEVRRKNLIGKFSEPHTTAVGQAYDVGDYEGALDKALEVAGYAELRAEQAARRARGDAKQLGIGVSVYVEITGGVAPFGEHARIEVLDDGRAVVYTGTSPHGQGHVTVVEHARPRADRHPDGPDRRRLGRHRSRPARVSAPWARGRCSRAAPPCASPPASWSTRPASWPPSCSRPTRPTSCSTRTPPRSTSPARRRVAKTLGRARRSPPRASPTCPRAWPHAAYFAGQRGHVPVRRPRRRRRGRHRDRPGQAPAPRRLRRRRPRAQPDAARRADPRWRRPGYGAGAARRGALRQRRQPDHVEPGRLRLHLGGRTAERRGRPHGDARRSSTRSARRASARAARSARPPRCSRPSSTRSATSGCATSTCPPPPNGSGTPSPPRRSERHLASTVRVTL